jgi:hypothetical protein
VLQHALRRCLDEREDNVLARVRAPRRGGVADDAGLAERPPERAADERAREPRCGRAGRVDGLRRAEELRERDQRAACAQLGLC